MMFENVPIHAPFVGEANSDGGAEEQLGEKLFESMSERFKRRVVDTHQKKRGEKKSALHLDGGHEDDLHTRRAPCKPESWCGMAVWNDHKRGDGEQQLEEEPMRVTSHHVNVKSAWLNAAMAWRQKNMPSAVELKKRKAEMSRRMSDAARKRHAKSNRFVFGRCQDDTVKVPPKPDDHACESDWKVYFRLFHSARIAHATSFVQVLRTFDIPCRDPKKIKLAYMQAVRMYHPDSNSRCRCWSTAREKAEAEEIMKLINQRKPDNFL